jgi:starch-binding outer membrane protein, SusD/RagB family
MRIIIKYAAVVLVAASTALTSCKKDFLDLTNEIALTPQQALGTEADLLVALRGAYSSLRNVDMFGRTLPIIGDVMGDNAYQSALNTNRYTAYNNYTFTTADGNVSGIWNAGYNSILRANNIINSAVTTTAKVDQYKGEAYAIRALTYFYLVRYFARPYTDNPAAMGVPIVTSFNPDLKPGRNTVAEVYALILDDLNKAYTLMTQYTNSSQFSKYAARALQAKVYITMGDKPNALTAALDVINNGGFTPLTTANHAGYWANSVVTTTKLETLFEVSSDAVANLSFDALSYLYSQSGNYGDILASDNLISTFTAGDVRLALYPQVTRAGVLVYSVNKYPVTSGDLSDTKVLRLSEMYLIAAEASYPASETNARTYLNFIRTNRGAAAISSTGAQLFEDIIAERRRELAMEGDRYMDLMRLKRDVVRTTPNYPSSALLIPYANFRRILPIPQGEADANENIRNQQNPGY